MNRFLQFIRRNSLVQTDLYRFWRFQLSCILNLDEVPIPFEFFDGCTYHLKGEHTVTGSVSNTSWSKRQATLVLYIFADGQPRIKPKLIFHGVPGGKIWQQEHQLWDPRVTVELSESAYNNEELLVTWLEKELFKELGGRGSLLVMDSASFHKTKKVRQLLRANQVTLAVVPPGCTGLLQPLDVAVNKPFKALLRYHLEQILNAEVDGEVSGRAAVSARRIAVTKAVGNAWDELCDQKRQVIVQSFVHTGIAINPTGSEDHFISIKDCPNVNFTGWERAEEIDEAAASLKIEESDDGFGWGLPVDEGEFLSRQKHLYQLETVRNLKLLCRGRSLPRTSQLNKAELIERLLQADAKGSAASNPILIDGLTNELPEPEIAGQRSWEIEYAREAEAELIEQRRLDGEFDGLLGR